MSEDNPTLDLGIDEHAETEETSRPLDTKKILEAARSRESSLQYEVDKNDDEESVRRDLGYDIKPPVQAVPWEPLPARKGRLRGTSKSGATYVTREIPPIPPDEKQAVLKGIRDASSNLKDVQAKSKRTSKPKSIGSLSAHTEAWRARPPRNTKFPTVGALRRAETDPDSLDPETLEAVKKYKADRGMHAGSLHS